MSGEYVVILSEAKDLASLVRDEALTSFVALLLRTTSAPSLLATRSRAGQHETNDEVFGEQCHEEGRHSSDQRPEHHSEQEEAAGMRFAPMTPHRSRNRQQARAECNGERNTRCGMERGITLAGPRDNDMP